MQPPPSDFYILEKEHYKIREVLLDIKQLLEQKADYSVAKKLQDALTELQDVFLKHTIQEEKEWSKITQSLTHPLDEVIHYFLADHQMILGNIEKVKAESDQPSYAKKIKGILTSVEEHFYKEENGLFPMVKQLMKQQKNIS